MSFQHETMGKDEGITVKKDEDFSEWFTQLMQKAELADTRYNVKGFPVYMSWSTMSMHKMWDKFEKVLQKKGHEPVLFPAVIPESNFKLEGEHVKGFAPAVFWITETGSGEKLEEKLAMRPTSETAFYQMYSLWIRSYKDLPFKRYQRCQVWRAEDTKSTRPFLRTREIYWIEAHDVFATEQDAIDQVHEDMETTKEVLLDEFAMPFIFFQRPEWDKFPGAVHTYAADALMPSGKVSQLPSTHLLGENFSKPFNVKFKDKDGKEKYAQITCYGPGISRIYGALIALHGDNKGLVLPFDIAPVQVIIVPIFNDSTKATVLKKCSEYKEKITKLFSSNLNLSNQNYVVKIDDREGISPGWKFNNWEMKGVPIRIELGPKDMENKSVTLFRRDLNQKSVVKETDLIKEVEIIQKSFTKNMIKKAEDQFKGNTVDAKSIDEIKKAINSEKIVRVNFCSIDKDGVPCAEVIEKEVQAQVRGKKLDEKEKAKGKCVVCGKVAKEIVYIARAY